MNLTNDNNITMLDKDKLYSATLTFYSKGDSSNVSISVQVSDAVAEDYDGPIPAAYSQLQELVMSLRKNAMLYAPTEQDAEMLEDDSITVEEKASLILDRAAAQEEAANAVVH